MNHIVFNSVEGRYGYRRIYAILKRSGIVVSEKVVRRIMQEEGLVVYRAKRKKYNSYAGEISPHVENVIKRDFHADSPNTKWLTIRYNNFRKIKKEQKDIDMLTKLW